MIQQLINKQNREDNWKPMPPLVKSRGNIFVGFPSVAAILTIPFEREFFATDSKDIERQIRACLGHFLSGLQPYAIVDLRLLEIADVQIAVHEVTNCI